MGKVIAVTSGEGGTGKSTTVAAISSYLALAGNKTLCLDYNAGSDGSAPPQADEGGGQRKIVPGERFRVATACSPHPGIPFLYFLSLPASYGLRESDADDLVYMFNDIRREFDYCLIEVPFGNLADGRLLHASADVITIVTSNVEPEKTDVRKAAKTAFETGAADVCLIVNRIQPGKSKYLRTLLDDITAATGVRLVGLIPDDKKVVRAQRRHIPLVLYKKGRTRRAALHFKDATTRLLGKRVPWRLKLHRAVAIEKAEANLPKRFDSLYGDPSTWAQSTLSMDENRDIVKIHEISQGMYVSRETVRQRMWLHEVLDDAEILYHIEFTGRWATRKKYIDAQQIYVRREDKKKVQYLIREYNNTDNFIRDDIVGDGAAVNVVDGIPQRACLSCGREIDFDYVKCPYCGDITSEDIS